MTFTKSGFEGLAWPVTVQSGRLLSVSGNAGLAEFDSSSAETIAKAHAYIDQVVAGSSLTLDIYPSADLPHSTTVDTFRPNEDSGGAGWETDDGTTPLFEHIDEATLDKSDWIEEPNGTTNSYEHLVGSGSYSSAGRITELRYVAVVEHPSGSLPIGVELRVNGTQYDSDDDHFPTVSQSDGVVTHTWRWEKNPDTGDRWTDADVQAFDGPDDNEVIIKSGSGDGGLRVYQSYMEVDSVPAPAATGEVIVAASGWAEFALESNWSKGKGTTYSVVLFKTNADGRCVWPLLDSGSACPHVGWQSRVPTMDGFLVTDVGDVGDAVHPVVLEDDGGSASADSQPYAQLVREAVHSGRTVEQEVTPSASLTAGWVRVVAACHPDTSEDLSVEVRKRSDDSVVGTLTVSPDDLPDPDSPRKLQQVDGALDSTGSVDTTQHYVHLSSSAAEATQWEVAVLDADAPPVSAESAGFGGVSDQATVDGTEDDDLDAPATFAAIPSTPANFAAVQGASGGQVDLSWDATALGGSFDRYEILRAGQVIAKITTESTTSLTDTGALQDVQETWEVRVVDTDGIASQTASATATASKASGSHRLTSLHDASVDMDVKASISGMTWAFHEQRSVSRQMGRDGARVERATKGRGEDLEVTAVLQDGEDRALFDDLLEARDADVPHLVLTTLWGARRYVAVVFDEASERSIVTLGRATVRLVEVATRPTAVEIA